MTYSVKEIYYTLQGEGAQTGRAAVFLRFAGCNLWSGLEKDRGQAVCQFCDTDFVGTDGPERRQISRRGIAGAGGERAMAGPCRGQALCGLHRRRTFAATGRGGGEGAAKRRIRNRDRDQRHLVAAAGIDWICVSPKADAEQKLMRGDELKLVYPQDRRARRKISPGQDFTHFFLQPMDNAERVPQYRGGNRLLPGPSAMAAFAADPQIAGNSLSHPSSSKR